MIITKVYIRDTFSRIINTFYSFRCKNVINGWFQYRCGVLLHRNLGDELNVYLLESLGINRISSYRDILHFGQRNTLVIGSIIEGNCTPKSIIWGSGIMYGGAEPLRAKPLKVCAVRGKLSRQYLIENGVECPEVYGDPALLMPFVYRPCVNKKYQIGIIPHVCDIGEEVLKRLITGSDYSVHVIKFDSYTDWHNVIDEINECEFIISSSLHGLILSDAYGIPNIWVRFSNKIMGGEIKYLDYFSGVGRREKKPIMVDGQSLDELYDKRNDYINITFDPMPLIQACPFNIKIAKYG